MTYSRARERRDVVIHRGRRWREDGAVAEDVTCGWERLAARIVGDRIELRRLPDGSSPGFEITLEELDTLVEFLAGWEDHGVAQGVRRGELEIAADLDTVLVTRGHGRIALEPDEHRFLENLLRRVRQGPSRCPWQGPNRAPPLQASRDSRKVPETEDEVRAAVAEMLTGCSSAVAKVVAELRGRHPHITDRELFRELSLIEMQVGSLGF